MDNLFHTVAFTAVAGFFQSLGAEINGRIFLTTFIAYAVSYMIYSGYMSWFADGYGSILLTQVGFSVIDLLGLFPMAFLLLVESLWPFAKSVGKFILLSIVIPFLVLWATANIVLAWNIRVFPENAALTRLGILLWVFGSVIQAGFAWQWKNYKWIRWLSIFLSYSGVILAGLTVPFVPTASAVQPTVTPSQMTEDWIVNLIFEVLAVLIFIILPMFPLVIGRSMASHAVKQNLLSRVKKLILKQPLELPRALSLEKATKKKKTSSEEKNGMVSYHWEKDRPIYLVASLSKTTALYIPPETNSTEKGSLVLLANDLICAMEI